MPTLIALAAASAALLAAGKTAQPAAAESVPFEVSTAACAKGEPRACHRLAERVLSGAEPDERAQYVPAFESGCARKVADACAGLGMAQAGRASPKDRADGETLLDEACRRGSSVACAWLAEQRMKRTEDGAVRAQLLARATEQCDKLGGSVCFSVASAHYEGWGAPADSAKGDGFATRACETGSGYACFSQGADLVEKGGDGGAQRARPLLERSCAADVGAACALLAGVLVQGRGGLKKDAAAATAFATRACDLREPQGCDFLAETNEGRSASSDQAAFADEQEKLRVYRKYCDRGGAEACSVPAFSLGDRAERSGELRDMEEVVSLLQKGCRHGSMRSCNVLGHVAKDAVRACDAGNPGQCLVAGFVYAQGTSIPRVNGPSYPKDEAEAGKAFEKACKGGQKAACERAAPRR